MKRATVAMALIACVLAAAWAADEITVTSYLSIKNSTFEYVKNVNQLRRTQTNLGSSMAVQSIMTNAPGELVVINSDVATNGYAFFRNVTTNTDRCVDIGPYGGATYTNAIIRLEAGDVALLRLHPTKALWARAIRLSGSESITGVNLENWILED